MITLCTVTLELVNSYMPIFLKSVSSRTRLVNEVLIAKVDAPSTLYEEWEIDGIKFKKFGFMDDLMSISGQEHFPRYLKEMVRHRLLGRTELFADVGGRSVPKENEKHYDRNTGVFTEVSPTNGHFRSGQSVEHALALHECIKRASNEHVLLHDPDVFYYVPADDFFYRLMTKYDLNAIGVSHSGSTGRAFTYFPYLSNILLKKSELPNDDWLNGRIIDDKRLLRKGKFLIRTRIPEFESIFPNPNGDFDTGSFLWLWSYQNNWKWLAFQTADARLYTTKYYRGSVKVKEKFGNQKLLYQRLSDNLDSANHLPQ